MELKIHEKEELIWLVSILFTDKFYDKNKNIFLLFDSGKHKAYWANILKEVSANPVAKNLLEKIKSDLIYSPDEIRPKDENLQKVDSFDFLYWAEKNEVKIPQVVLESAKWLIEKQAHKIRMQKQEREKFSSISIQEFELLQKEPLWPLCKAVLHINGFTSNQSPSEIIEFIKYKANMNKLCLYITQADQNQKIKLLKKDVPYEPLVNLITPDYKLIEFGSVEPKEFINWAVNLPLEFDLLQSSVPTYVTDQISSINSEEDINPKRKTSLYKLVLVMAIEKYKYNPKSAKNSSTANIQSALDKYGLSIDENTIRAVLDEAYGKLNEEIILNENKN